MASRKASSSKRGKCKGRLIKVLHFLIAIRPYCVVSVVTEGDLESDEATRDGASSTRYTGPPRKCRRGSKTSRRVRLDVINCLIVAATLATVSRSDGATYQVPREEELRMRRRSMGLIFPIKATYKNQHGYKLLPFRPTGNGSLDNQKLRDCATIYDRFW